MIPYYADDGIEIYHGDCRDVLPGLNRVNLTLTDAPYNGSIQYGDGTDDSRPWPEYAQWLMGIITQCETITDGPVISFVSKPGLINLIRIRPPWWIGAWVGGGANPAGPNQGLMLSPGYEPAVFYGDRYGLKACIPDVWNAPTESDRWGHPCPKPLTLMRDLLVRLAPSSVLDPFMGSGTTLRAAKDLGIPAIGIEIEERYCQIAVDRLAQGVLAL